MAVHPHVCGEHITFNRSLSSLAGSSPRVWGAYHQHHERQGAGRFIPTCVGSISEVARKPQDTWVHPHVCGEHWEEFNLEGQPAGSSPRVWGAWLPPIEFCVAIRFIPTCVGSICRTLWSSRRLPVHPHVCGEHVEFVERAILIDGSSPRVWGACNTVGRVPQCRRFIPTCVGSILGLGKKREFTLPWLYLAGQCPLEH